jgi:hypothetical protein
MRWDVATGVAPPSNREDRFRSAMSTALVSRSPDERESYEELEGRWRAEERLGSHATIKRCEAKWEWLVQQIEVGYDALLESGKTTSTLG